MKKDIKYLSKDQTTSIHAVIWEPDTKPIGIIQIVHGMNEHINRYESTANFFLNHGYIVCGHDTLGHGKSVIDSKHFGYFAKKHSGEILVEDTYELTRQMKEKYPNLPIALLGYSFGSLITRNYLPNHSQEIDSLILIGSPNHSKLKMIYAQIVSTIIGLYKGGEFYRSKHIENLTTGSFKKYYKTVNKLAWMSKDTEYLSEYVKDPYVRFRFTINGYKGLFSLIYSANNNLKKIQKKDLPILILSGKDDPVTNFGASAIKLDKIMKKKGLTNSKYKTYNGLRHSLLNEVEKTIVLNDLLYYLNKLFKKEV